MPRHSESQEMVATPYSAVLQELKDVQSNLRSRVQHLWMIHRNLWSALQDGCQEDDFWPRRLAGLKKESQQEFQRLLFRLTHLVSERLDSSYAIFSRQEEAKILQAVSHTYCHLAQTLLPSKSATLSPKGSLPAYSLN